MSSRLIISLGFGRRIEPNNVIHPHDKVEKSVNLQE